MHVPSYFVSYSFFVELPWWLSGENLQEMQVQSVRLEGPLEKEMATCSGTLAWEIPDRAAWWAIVPGVAEELDTT